MKGLATVCALSLSAVALPAASQTQPHPRREAARDWSVNLGVGAVYGFAPLGGGTPDQLNPLPWADFNWRDRIYGNPLDGLGYNVVKRDHVRVGVQLRPRYGGPSDIERLDLPGLGADAAVYGYWRLPGDIVVGGRATAANPNRRPLGARRLRQRRACAR